MANRGLTYFLSVWLALFLEVDLLIASANTKELIEIKSSFIYNNRDTASLGTLGKLINEVKKRYKLIYAGDLSFNDKEIEVMSWKKL